MLNRKRRPSTQKKGLKSNRRYLRTIKNQKKDYTPPSAPYNTSQYLIENNSSPFFDQSDDDIDADFVPSSLILIKESENLIDDTALDLKKISSFFFLIAIFVPPTRFCTVFSDDCICRLLYIIRHIIQRFFGILFKINLINICQQSIKY